MHRLANLSQITPLGTWLLLVTFLGTTAVARSAEAPADTEATVPASDGPAQPTKRRLGVLLYPRFELLDVYGPVEVFGNLGPQLEVVMVAAQAGPVTSAQGPKVVADYGLTDCPPLDLLLIPGGFGTLTELKNEALLAWMRERAEKAELVMSVCSGSALLAKAGLLDGRRATSNKKFFQLAVANGPRTEWIREARWVDDGNRVTSSGVSAGIDMALAVTARLFGQETAEAIAEGTEYQWHRDPASDPFAYLAAPPGEGDATPPATTSQPRKP